MALLKDYFGGFDLIGYKLGDYIIYKKSSTLKGQWSKVNSQKKCTFAPPKRMDNKNEQV